MNSTDAKARLTAATNATAQARAELTETREAVSVGEATAKDVTRATRALVRAQEHEDQARADLRVVERREAAEAEANAREVARIRRELDAITRQKAAVEAAKYREFLEATRAAAEGFNSRLGGFEQQLGYRSLIVPGRFTSFGLLSQALADQLTHFTKPTGSKEA